MAEEISEHFKVSRCPPVVDSIFRFAHQLNADNWAKQLCSFSFVFRNTVVCGNIRRCQDFKITHVINTEELSRVTQQSSPSFSSAQLM